MIQSPGLKSLSEKFRFIRCNLLNRLYVFYYNVPPLFYINLEIRCKALSSPQR
jgi:hypothetical protein